MVERSRAGTSPWSAGAGDRDRGLRDRTAGSDVARTVALSVAVVLQTVAGALGGSGALGEAVGTVANSYPTLVQPGGAAFSIWTLIYVLVLALAVRAALSGQRHREVHRQVGWWVAAAGVLNASWVLVFTQRWVVVAEVVIVALLVVLYLALLRLREHPATGWADRLLLHTPVGVYTGWVTVATVAGAASTGVALGFTPPWGLAVALGVFAVLGTTCLAVLTVTRVRPAAGYAAAVAWALAWIAVATSATLVIVASAVGALAVVLAATRALWTARDRTRFAWG
ncbi:tryptophan-rich sensory protein [Saccharomonospora sp. NB11]|jgi:tryptophan-rich sensory protein|uniref:tryptophan-rich sensory protein n=1 Tax=Saccharomonospora sp. NB11 TaxID=1642298 RepID=UPI001E502764|nr:tryptophan-rich sensory protein [Saccharomonospora sp. NB11]